MRVEQDNLTRLYQPILLEKALTIIHQPYQQFAEDGPALQEDPLLSSQQAFEAFVNKLAQACDSKPRGDTVTAVTVLRNASNFPLYIVASNFRNEKDLYETKCFLGSLLHTIRDEQEIGRKPLHKKIMWQLLSFSFPRVKLYLSNLVRCLDECLKKCTQDQDSNGGGPVPEIEMELSGLRAKAVFPREIATQNLKTKFLSDCETCIKAIHGARRNAIDEVIRSQSRNGEMAISQAWQELRHYFGRLLSYRQSAEILLGAFDRWPSLFTDFEVATIPSSLKGSRPLPKSNLTAEEIILNMSENEKEAKTYLEQAYNLQKMGLDERIQEQLNKRTFQPVVHAEVALHLHLLRFDLNHPRKYWNDYKYIGCSKPTCRLCSYYFFAHRDKVKTRHCHDNLYVNWQFPPAPKVKGRLGLQANEELLRIITVLVQNDAKRTLDERRARGKKHDSNTESATPGYFDRGSQGSSSETRSSRRPDGVQDLQQRLGTWENRDDDWDHYELIASGGDGAPGNDGASISGERY